MVLKLELDAKIDTWEDVGWRERGSQTDAWHL
jgi:hypothetical protein